MSALVVVALIVLAVTGWAAAIRAANRLTTAHIRIVQLESRGLPDVPIYEQMRVWLCAKCGHGSQEHGMAGHAAFHCVADMVLAEPFARGTGATT